MGLEACWVKLACWFLLDGEQKTNRAVVYQRLWQEEIPFARWRSGTRRICIRQPRLVSVCGGDFDTSTWGLSSRTLQWILLLTGKKKKKALVEAMGSKIYSLTGGGAALLTTRQLSSRSPWPCPGWSLAGRRWSKLAELRQQSACSRSGAEAEGGARSEP